MDSSGFRPSANVQDRRSEQGTAALLFAALKDRLEDPNTPEHEKPGLHRRLSALITYEWHPEVGFQGGEPTHNNLNNVGHGPRHIGALEEPPVSPIHAAMGIRPERFSNPAQDMRTAGIFGEMSDLIQRPQELTEQQELARALMQGRPNKGGFGGL